MSVIEFRNQKKLSEQELLAVGLQDMAYIRPVFIDEEELYAIHAADGTPLSVLETMDDVLSTLYDNDLTLAPVN